MNILFPSFVAFSSRFRRISIAAKGGLRRNATVPPLRGGGNRRAFVAPQTARSRFVAFSSRFRRRLGPERTAAGAFSFLAISHPTAAP